MATKTIGASGKDYTTIAGWSAYVKALSSLTASEIGQCTDDAVYTFGASGDLDFDALTLNGYTVTFQATTNKHDGTFGTGSRVVTAVNWTGIYNARRVLIQDMSFENTSTSNGSCFTTSYADFERCIMKITSAGEICLGWSRFSNNTHYAESCLMDGGTIAAVQTGTDNTDSINNCTILNAAVPFDANETANHTGTIKNCASYNCTSAWSGTYSGTYANNASDDGSHPGSGGLTITSNPFDTDGHTPVSGSQLDGAGVDLSISLDAANNSFNATPSIGAYEVIAAASTGIPILRRRIEART